MPNFKPTKNQQIKHEKIKNIFSATYSFAAFSEL